MRDVQKLRDLLERATEALAPLAALGGHLGPRDFTAGVLHRAAFWDCPHDLVLYDDRMGAAITVGDVRRARALISQAEGEGA